MITNLTLAGKVGRVVELDSVLLRECIVRSAVDPYQMPSELRLDQEFRGFTECAPESMGHFIDVLVEFRFRADRGECDGADDDTEGARVLTIEAQFALRYSCEDGAQIGRKELDCFAQVNGPYNAWPYWRELVQSACGKAGLAGITVPVFRPKAIPVQDDTNSEE